MQLFLPVGMVTKPFQIVEKKSQQQHNEKKKTGSWSTDPLCL